MLHSHHPPMQCNMRHAVKDNVLPSGIYVSAESVPIYDLLLAQTPECNTKHLETMNWSIFLTFFLSYGDQG